MKISKKFKVGDIYIQRPLFKPKDDVDIEYVVIIEVGDSILFDLYFKDPLSGVLNSSPGEGKAEQFEEGFKEGDIIKATENEFVAWQAKLLLIN